MQDEELANQNRLEREHVYYRQLFKFAPVGCLITDNRGIIQEANTAAVKLLYASFESIIGKRLTDFLAEEDHQRIQTLIDQLKRGEDIDWLETVLQIQNHASSRVYLTVTVVPDDQGQGDSLCWVLHHRDAISVKPDTQIPDELVEKQLHHHIANTEAQAKISQALAEVESDYQQVLETIAVHISRLVGDACVVTLLSEDGQWLNPVAYHHPKPEATAVLRELLPLVPSPAKEGLAGRVVETGQPMLIPTITEEQARSVIRPEYWPYLERFRIASILIVPLRAQGQVIGTLGVIGGDQRAPYNHEDQALLQQLADRAALAIVNARLFLAVQNELAERLRIEQALRKSEARFRTIFKESVLGIELIDLEGRILTSNPAFQEMLGYSEEELEQMSFTDFTDPADIQNNQSLFKRLARGELNYFRLEKRYLHKNGLPLWGRQSVSLVRDEMGTPQYAVVIVENISEQKRMAAELAELQRRLLDSVEVERFQLAQKLHDDAIQDLYGVTFHLEGIRSTMNDKESISQLESAQSVLRQVIQVLRVTYKELRPPALVSFGLDKAISAHAEYFQLEHPEIDLRLDLIPDSQMLSERVSFTLFRIYQQALSNVLKHAQASQVDIRLRLDEEHMTLEIQDDGRGFTVPEGWIQLVRQGHYGLASASERAEAIGGKLKIVSNPDQGTLVQAVVPKEKFLTV